MATPTSDVVVCSQGAPGDVLARTLADGLTARGFRVIVSDSGAPEEAADQRLALIEQAGDFVLVLAPDESGACDLDERARREVGRALRTRRNVVRVIPAGAVVTPAGDAVPELAGLEGRSLVRFDAARVRESIALLAHQLSSDSTVEERRTARRARRFFWAAALILLGGIALQEVPRFIARRAAPRLLAPVPPFALQWIGVGERLVNGAWTSFPLGDRTTLAPGDRIRLVFSTTADGFAYAVARHGDGTVSMLFPTDAVRSASRVRAGERHTAPVDGGWLTVAADAPLEALFLVAGYDAQQNLEELLEEPASASNAGARRALLDATLSGLLDGRHGAAERRIWTGRLHPIDSSLPIRPIEPHVAIELSSGASADEVLAVQPGLASACVELHFSRN